MTFRLISTLFFIFTIILYVSSAPVESWYVHIDFHQDLDTWTEDEFTRDRTAVGLALLSNCDMGYGTTTSAVIGSSQWGTVVQYRTWFNIKPDSTKCTRHNLQQVWDEQVKGNKHSIKTIKISSQSELYDPAICSSGTHSQTYVQCKTINDACPQCPTGRSCLTDDDCESNTCLENVCSIAINHVYSLMAIMIISIISVYFSF